MQSLLFIALIGFASAHYYAEQGACAKKRDGANSMIPGRYIPQCSANGDYQAVQNHASTGHYWCVDVKTGEEVDGTRQRFVKPECDGRPSKCDTERAKALGSNKVGHFIPKCASNGDYERRQNHGSTGQSWCVNPKTGVEIPGTRTRRPSRPFYCGPSKCERERAAATNGPPRPGQFIPACAQNGDYESVQNHASTGHYFCVDIKTGNEVEGTRQRAVPDCEGRPSKCDKERAAATNGPPRPGQFIPTCAQNGDYESVQNHASTGHYFCVDVKTGNEVEGTRQRGVPDCEARPSKCDKERAVAKASNKFGRFVPKCASNGEYAIVQSHGSTGHSWCVDPKTGIEVEGTRQRGETPDCDL